MGYNHRMDSRFLTPGLKTWRLTISRKYVRSNRRALFSRRCLHGGKLSLRWLNNCMHKVRKWLCWFCLIPTVRSLLTRVSRYLTNLLRLELKQKLTYVQKKVDRRFYLDNRQPWLQLTSTPLYTGARRPEIMYLKSIQAGQSFRTSEQPVELLEWARLRFGVVIWLLEV